MELKILKFDHFGRGIGKVNEKVIFVDKALPTKIELSLYVLIIMNVVVVIFYMQIMN